MKTKLLEYETKEITCVKEWLQLIVDFEHYVDLEDFICPERPRIEEEEEQQPPQEGVPNDFRKLVEKCIFFYIFIFFLKKNSFYNS